MDYSKTRFNQAPTYHGKKRTRFDLSHNETTTCNTGEFIPVYYSEVYPGETFTLNTASLVRLKTSLHQTLDNAYAEVAFFFVPWRIVWENWDKFLGANDDPWAQQTTYTVPQLRLTGTGSHRDIYPGSLLNHLCLPSGSYGFGNTNPCLTISILPLRAVFQVYNDWYRDENYDSIVYFSKANGDTQTTTFTFNGGSFSSSTDNLRVNRFKDLFSTALPAPQKGSPITISLGGVAPIDTDTTMHDLSNGAPQFAISNLNDGNYINLLNGTGGIFEMKHSVSNFPDTRTIDTSDGSFSIGPGSGSIDSTNLIADLSQATSITINQLRLAIAAQAIKEREARGGTRYKEIIESTWHIDCPDARLDRAEFLGGKRFPINMMEVLQTSETGTTVLGSDAGHSKTADYSEGFARTFLEHGCILGFFYVRTSRSYNQGINRQFFRKEKLDFYDPLMDNIGEVAVLNREIMALKTDTAANVAQANEAFGYQEAWYELKESTNRYSGYFQPGISGTLDSWHYGDDYRDSNGDYVYPSISAAWLKETATNVDRTIAVQSSVAYQWDVQLHFEAHAVRQMNKYSIPNTFGF